MTPTTTPPAVSPAVPLPSNTPTVTQAPPKDGGLGRESISDKFSSLLSKNNGPVVPPLATPAPAAPVAAPVAPAKEAIPAPTADTPPVEAPVAKSVDEVEFDATPTTPATTPIATQPTTSPVATSSGYDPTVTATQIATDLGIAPEVLTGSPRGRQLLAANRLVQTLQSIEQGGLGYVPAIDEIKEAFDGAAAIDSLDYEFEANPQNVVLWMSSLQYNPQTRQYTPRPGVEKFLETIPQTLQQLDPRLYRAAAQPYISAMADELYQIAADGQTPEDKERLTLAARHFEQTFLAKDRTQRRQIPDHIRQREEQLTLQQREIEQRNQSIATQRSEGFRGAVLSSLGDSLMADAQKVINDTGHANDQYISHVRDAAIEKALDLVFGNPQRGISPVNPSLQQRWNTTLQRYAHAAQRSKQDPQRLVEQARRLVQPQLRRALAEELDKQNEKTQAQSTVVHAQAAVAAARTEPRGDGSPRPGSVAPTPADKQSNESNEDFALRRFNDRFSSARMQGQRV